MDFTYFVAFFLSIFVGLIGSLIFTVKGAKAPFRWMGIALVTSVIFDLLILIDWSHADGAGGVVLLTSALFFVAYGLVGTVIGFLPAFVVIGLTKLMGRWPPR